MARIRTLDFLPEIFQTSTNSEFLAATLDQIVNPPSTIRIQGYVGSKLGYGINATNNYVIEPTKIRTDYQLDPAVVFTKKDEEIAQDFISYPGMIDALNLQGAVTNNNSRLFESQFYSWDSFTDLDKLINYNQYYWLPFGAPAVTVSAATVFASQDYVITDLPNGYSISELGSGGAAVNPTLTLLRGGVYNFAVSQSSQFWIQGEPGVTGYSPAQPNLYTRDVYGVSNNGASQGIVNFAVPNKDAQDEFNFPYNTTVDVISDIPFDQVNGARLQDLTNGIDGVTGLNGLTVMFYNTGVVNETGYVSSYFGETEYDTNLGLVEPVVATVGSCDSSSLTLSDGTTDLFYAVDPNTGVLIFAQPTITFNSPAFGGIVPGQVYYVNNVINSTDFTISETLGGSAVSLTPSTGAMPANINQGLYEEGFYTPVSQNFYQVEYVGDPNDPVLRLNPTGLIPINTKITAIYGQQYVGLGFYKNVAGNITQIPYISAPKDILYYQDGTTANKVGVIRLIESNVTNTLDVETDILGQKNFTSTNGVVFTNGLKVEFDGDVVPASYLTGEYYVEGVGTGIQLLPVESLVVPETFTLDEYNPYDIAPYDIGNYDVNLNVPIDKDYITIARDSISKNAWSRSNRWFHIDVIRATATYNNNPNIVTTLGAYTNKANRPIIEFYPNLKMFNSGSRGKNLVDFFDTRQTDALSVIPGTKAYYPDVETYTAYAATIASTVTSPVAPSTFVVGQTYQINTLGTTDWNVVAGTSGASFVIGQRITCAAAGTGTGTATLLDTNTTITVSEDDITGLFQVGMYVGDTDAILPTNTQITSISGTGTGTLTLAVEWPTPENIAGASNASIVGTDTTVNNYEVFPGSRIIFSEDTTAGTRTKIYVVDISEIVTGEGPVITLSLAEDAEILPDDQVAILRGYNYRGETFYYTGTEYLQAQQKVTVNQAPLFDVFDENGISFGDTDVYNGSSFLGNKLFAYGVSDSTIDDPVLGFPVRISSIDNVGDISFDVSLNVDTFDYVSLGNPITQKVNTGYVYNFNTRVDYTRLLGWETTVAPSTQYQVFDFPYNQFSQPSQFTCDIAMSPELADGELGWPRIQVYFNNEYQSPENYSVSVGANQTVVTILTTPDNPNDTVVQVLLLSDQVSPTAYYTIPINLSNNPFNGDVTTVNVGDVRQQYRDIFINAPSTSGEIFGPNNYRDLGNLNVYGTKIIQNSASLVLPGTFLRKKEHDLYNSLLFNSREYIKYKQLIVDTVQNTDYVQRYTPSEILDDALDQITDAKSQLNAFFWSDMLPNKSPYRSNTYTFNNSLDTSIYPLSQIYNFETANYNGVLVYLTRTEQGITFQQQLLSGVDYVVSTDSPSLTVTLDLLPGDNITVKEYNQTYGSYIPNTPTKLGLYQAFEPSVVLDSNYNTPTYFIKGHDGSYTKLYGEYLPELNILVDFRDQALLEFEKRVYNNLKLSTEVPIYDYEVVPGYFRDPTYSWEEFLEMYSTGFLNWVGQNRLDYKTQFFNKLNEWTYNYTNSQNKLDRAPILQGYWRGLYEYLYDTTTPESTPWEMLGFANQPTWWTERYGPAPYTSDNDILWGDLEAGYVWNNGDSYIIPELARPGLSVILPVNSAGELLTPFVSTVANYNPSTFQKDWKVGDMGPVELSYRRSSSWPFDVIRLFSLTRPAEFFNLAVDLDNYKYNAEFNQYLVNNRQHLIINDVEIYGNGTAKTSYINWIVDYEKQLGIAATENITSLLDSLDVRLAYRLAGFSDKTLLKFYVEKGSPNSNNASLLIPDESYQVLLYDNQAYDQLMFTGVIIQRTDAGWSVYGNSQTFAYFTTLEPIYNGNNYTIEVPGASVRVTNDYGSKEVLVPYGTIFYSYQELSQFLLSYAAYLQSKGMIFDTITDGREVNWVLMVQEFLYWLQIGWEVGSVITLNPSANGIKINKESTVVEPLTIQQQNFILNQDLYPIQLNNLSVYRKDTEFNVQPLNTGDSLSYGQFNLNNFEHAIVFNNVTLFNDIIYNLITGLKQNRISVSGTKTADWDGTVNAYGFILNQDNVNDWSPNIKYTKGQIVKYKNRYYSALSLLQPALVFEELNWALVDYENIQKGMLPNSSTRAYESTLYYNVNKANIEQDADLLSYSLIGYRPRDYLALVDLTDITQINVYKNLIRNKGTRNATLAFKGANLPQGGIDYDVYENWAIQSGSYGGTLNENFVEFKINQTSMTGNPSIVALTEGVYTPGANQEIPLYSLFNYGRSITTPNILSTTYLTNPNPLYPNAGYVNFNDVEMASYYFAGLPAAVDASGIPVPINEFYVRDYMWLANFKEKWGVFSWKSIGQVLQVAGNLNGTATVTFAQPHNLKRLDPLSIINFATNVDGYYIVTEVLGLNQVIINLSVGNATNNAIQGFGIGLSFVNQRVATPADIKSIDLLEAEFQKNTVWVDENNDGDWAVYRKSINYQSQGQLEVDNSTTYGTAVAYTPDMGYLVSDAGAGILYRYGYDDTNGTYSVGETITEGTSFGTKIVYANNIYVVSEPTSGTPTVYVYTLNNSILSDDIVSYQTIVAPMGVTNWGTELAISDDTNWIYISDLTNGKVYVYRKQNINLTAEYLVQNQTYVITSVGDTDFVADFGAIENSVGITFVANANGVIGSSGTGTAMQITYEQSAIIDGSVQGLVSADGFAKSTSTNQNGSVLIVGAPNKNFSSLILDNGAAYVYQRTVQNVEAPNNSIPNTPQTFQLAWTPTTVGTTVASTTAPNTIELASTSDISLNDPIIFTGLGLGNTGIETNQVYYVESISGTDITIKTTRSTTTEVEVDTVGTITGVTATVQTTPLYVNVNGTLVDDINYASVGSLFYYTGTLQAGDIVNISDNQFNMLQTLNNDYVNRTNIQFGYDLDVNKQGSDILVGSPFEIDDKNREGAVYRFTNGGARHGIVIGTSDVNVVGNRNLLINGFLVPLTPGDADHIAATINTNNISNVQAAATNGKLVIQVINNDITVLNEKLVITAFDGSTLNELGLQIFTKTQIITCPHEQGPTQFGSAIKLNDSGSVVISAPVGTRYEGTTFDFTDDEQLDNDTVFDNNATRFVESYPNAGAVYMFDFLSQNNESLLNPGSYVYAQPVNSNDIDYGFNPEYGYSLDFNENVIMVGSPNYQPALIGGQVIVNKNNTGVNDWAVYRQSSPIVDIEKIQNTQLFSAETNNTLVNLDYMDPLQGKLLGAVRQDIDYVSSVDPAKYNSDLAPITGQVWGAQHVGEIWFSTGNVRFLNYHQNDPVYNAKYWGTLFPGSDVAVYTWVASNVPPNNYQGTGSPLDVNLFSVSSTLNASGIAVPIYYFWVRNSNIIAQQLGKRLSDTIIASYIANPRASGVAFMAPILPNAFALYNCSPYINANDSVFHVGFANGTNDDAAHNEFTLVRENYPDDFLPGLPSRVIKTSTTTTNLTQSLSKTSEPYGLYDRMLDSLSGCDETGQVVPNPFLPKAVQSGILARPRQSFFYNRFKALNNYLVYANSVLAQVPVAETRPDATFLFASGEFYNTPDYWEFINWWAPGYNDNTKSVLVVPIYADLAALTVPTGTIVKVEQNGVGKFEIYINTSEVLNTWTRIGLENGTIRFKSSLWDYPAAKLGFGGDFYDTTVYDLYPSEETRYIIRALNEQIYIDELSLFRNKSLILLFEYIQSETTESQNFLPWLNKTSLIDVSHTIRELLPIENLKTDNQAFLEGYINEVKPYHVVIKDFLFKYTGIDTFQGDITDFDLPAQYSAEYEKFISPQLVYGASDNEYEYSLDSTIWEDGNYSQWFANRGVSLVGEPGYQITTLTSYVTTGSNYLLVDNVNGFPINGVITIGTEEIAYSFVDRALNLVGGLLRGVNGTPISEHIPGELIYIDLPAVLLLNGGRGYLEPPKITAYIDTAIYPEPTVPAQLEAVMNLDSVLQINVINPGQGYAVLPQIIIDPAYTVSFNNTNVNNLLHTINIYAPNLRTGDIVRYAQAPTGETINKLSDGQWYYVGILENDPVSVIALYTNYADALQDHDRIAITADGVSVGMTLNAGAKASAITSASPIRENNITLRFDRTTYTSQVVDWETGSYYGSYFAGSYFNSESVSSSNILLDNENPDISTILASAQGVPFEISEVENDRQLTWSSFVRQVERTSSTNNTIRLVPSTKTFAGTASIAGTAMNITAITEGTVVLGTYVYGVNVNPDTTIISQTSGTPGGTGIYEVSISQSSASASVIGYETHVSGSTLGFYEGMPVKFEGYTIGGLVDSVEYYVKAIVNDLDFTISATDGGATLALTTEAVGLQTLGCYSGEVVDTAILTVNYPGILDVTATTAGTNTLTVPISEIGTGGTAGFYPNLPIFFTGNVFGEIVENDPYYVTTVIDNQTFTLSKTENPLTVDVTQTSSSTGYVTMDSTVGFSVNDAVIFTGTTYGNIVAGTVYYVRQIISGTQITLATAINGSLFNPGNSTDTMTIVSQADTVDLTTATGNMTMNVSLPVSPGQVNGQLFTLYTTSGQYPNISSGIIGNLIERDIGATIGDGLNRVALSELSGGTTNFYVNMPFRVGATVGGNLVAGTTFYVSEYSGETIPDPLNPGEFINRPNIEVTVLSTNASTDELTCSTIDTAAPTDTLYVGMPIIFSGSGLGGITIGQQYFVYSINVDGVRFQITDTVGGASPVNLLGESGTMLGTGDPYIVVVDSPGGTEIVLSDDTPVTPGDVLTTLDQFYTVTPVFDISYILGGYRAIVSNGGEGFAIDNTITILGTEVGGVSPANDITLTVNTINEESAPYGAITDVIAAGSVPSNPSQYYLKVVSPTQFAVYSDPLMEVPVSGIDFGFVGFTTAIAKTTSSTGNLITLPILTNAGSFEIGKTYQIVSVGTTDFTLIGAASNTVSVTFVATGVGSGTGTANLAVSELFAINDSVVFTGNVFGNIVLGQTYYIKTIASPTAITISETPAGIAFNPGNGSGTMTMAKAGSFAFLPEPFYFMPSIVKYLGRVWICIVSNNDDDFILGKWEELLSGDRKLNALDRVIGYYQPTVNMPGVDLTQLFDGVIYPYPIYYGNAFEPNQQYPLDVLLQPQSFYPTEVDLSAIVYDGSKYIAPANLPNYSAVVGSINSEDWVIGKLTNAGIGITDIIYGGDYYVMTSTNSATPILRSNDGIEWSTNGYYTPYSLLPYDTNPYDMTSLSVSALALNSVGFTYQTTSIIVNATNLVYGQRYAIRTVGTTDFTTAGASSNTVGTIFTATTTATGTGNVFLVQPVYVAVGENIIRSEDTYVWRQTTEFNPTYNYQLFGVSEVVTEDFSGFVAVGKGKMPDYSTGITELIDTDLIFYSNDSGVTWIQVNTVSPNGLNGVTSDGTAAIAVGERGAIYYSLNGATWLGVTEAGVSSLNTATNQINITSTIGLNVNDPIKFSKSFASIVAETIYYVKSIDSPTQITISTTPSGAIKQLVNITAGSFASGTSYVITSIGTTDFTLIGAASNTVGITFTATGTGTGTGTANIVAGDNIPVQTMMYQYDPADPVPSELRDVIYVNGFWIAVGDDGTVKTSTDYITWTLSDSGTSESLKGITFNSDDNSFTAVGDNNTIIVSDDNGTTWTSASLLSITPPVYDVVGSPFEFGYGPEELVPGVVSDNLAMIVTTKPGTTWPVVVYGHTGFNIAAVVLTPTSSTQTQYSFENVVEYPTQLTAQVVDGVTGLAQTLSESEYTIDWINKTITLVTPLSFLPVDSLRIEVYEAGNGNQLVKSSTDVNPIRQNSGTGFDEIYLNCNYTALSYEGGGAIRPGTEPITVLATATDGTSNRVVCESTDLFVLNSPITFQGVTFGNIQEDFTYYVKSISPATNSITISASYNLVTGLAGPTFTLVTATGTMYVNIQTGSGLVWADPLVYHNGERLILGETGLITKSSSSTNAFTTTTTSGLVTGERIMFSEEMFDSGVTPLTPYYVRDVLVGGNEFTISATIGGPVFPLDDASGTAIFVSSDFAIGLQVATNQAKLIFATDGYDNGQDYIVYSIFGETVPVTYGYSAPEIQEFIGNGSTTVFALANYVGGTNPENAVVEINGLRLLSSLYTINPSTNNLLLNITPAIGDVVRVTSYNDTDQQYLTTQYGITANPTNNIATLEVGQARHTGILFDDLASPTGSPPTVSGSFIEGQTYVINTVGTTNFTLIGAASNTVGVVFEATGPGTGTGTAYVGYDAPSQIPVASVNAVDLIPGNNYEITSLGTTDWNDVAGTVPLEAGNFVIGQTYIIETLGTTDFTLIGATSVNAGSFVSGTEYIITSLGSTDWDAVAGTTGETYVVGDKLTAQASGSGTGVALETLFVANGSGTGDGTANFGYLVGDIITVINTGSGTGTADTVNSAYDESLNWLVLSSGSTTSLAVGDAVIFSANPDMLGGLIENKTYYVIEIWNSTDFVVSDVPNGPAVVLTNDTGTMDVNANPFLVVPITNINNTITNPIAQVVAIATTTVTNEITVLSTDNFVANQTVEFNGDPADWTGSPLFGGINPGEIYFVAGIAAANLSAATQYTIAVLGNTDWNAIGYVGTPVVGGTFTASAAGTGTGEAFSATAFTIKDQDGNQIALSNGTGILVVTVGGTPAVTVTTSTPPGFTLNTRIRLDGISGSTQLNGNAYYVRPVTDTVFELYQQAYNTAFNATNYPVTTVSTYSGGGYIWQQGILYLITTFASETATSNKITVASTADLVENTPVYFSKAGEENGIDILGGIVQGTEYFVHTIYSITEFSVSTQQYGDEFTLTNDSGYINVTQWKQINVDRVWVTVNGYRVPSEKLRLSDFNELSILTTIEAGDEIIITNMIPTATPNEEIYINFVSATNEGTVYRENVGNRTWLTQPIYDLSTLIYVNDVNSVTDQIIQNVTTPSAVDGSYQIGLTAPRNLILSVQVVNNTTGNTVDPSNYSIVIEDLAPILKINAGSYITPGNELTVTTLIGGTILVNGEQINFGSVDVANNTLGNIQRGANGTAKQFLIPEYTVVYGLLNENKMADTYYDQVWNSYVYQPYPLGDPLQISETPAALFLESDAQV